VTLLAPKILKGFALQFIDNLEHSIPTALVRVLGLLAIAVGLAFIYVGIYVV
jgi:hypothetical protein